VTLSNPTNGVLLDDPSGTGTILNDDISVPVLRLPDNQSLTADNQPTFGWDPVSGAWNTAFR